MRSYRNPFRYRTSEQQQQQGLQRFLKTYGADVLDLLPEEIWDRPFVVRSAPGAGKTSLLRAFTVEALQAIIDRPDDHDELHRRMLDLGAIDKTTPRVLGVRVSLVRDYRGLVDLGVDAETARKLFFRLLDAHIIRAVCHSSLLLAERRFPDDLGQVRIEPASWGREALDRLGGPAATELLERARKADREIRNLLDSVLPIAWEGVGGHSTLYSLRALSASTVHVAGKALPVRVLLMFDDGQELEDGQRAALLEVLTDRELELCRWYTERFSALTPQEVIGDGEPGRSYVVLHLERETRAMGGQIRRGRRLRAFERMLLEIADRRSSKPLADYGDETETTFSEFLEPDADPIPDPEELTTALRQRVVSLAGGHTRYGKWIDAADELRGYQAALRWRELEIVITRDRDRPQLELLDQALAPDEFKDHSDTRIREAAALFLRHEFRVPFYYGADRISKLASQNVEQFLNLSGNLFEEMLALMTLRRRPWLDPPSQDRIVRETSETVWRSIPQRRSYGRDIQHLLLRIAALSRKDTYRPKASYAPGATGTALSMRDRTRLLDPEVRARIPGADELLQALAGAIGHNLLFADLDRPVKADRWMVLYLNRLLCARFELPLGYGGFRERSLEEMCSWMAEPIEGDLGGIQEALVLGA